MTAATRQHVLSLASLVRPATVAEFLDQSWGRGVSVFRHSIAGGDEVLSLSSFEEVLSTLNRPHEGWLHFARGGVKPVPAEMVDSQGLLKLEMLRRAFVLGETLYLTKAERICAPLMHIARSVELELLAYGVLLRESVNAHVFLTPPRSQGFPAHRDEHASFILQLDGCKEWTVYEPASASAVGADGPLRPGAVASDALQDYRACTYALQKGDVLYMPEWWPHEARAADAHSLHVTLRIFPLRWTDLAITLLSRHPGLTDALPRFAARCPEELTAVLFERVSSPDFQQGIALQVGSVLRERSAPQTVLPSDGFRQVLNVHSIAPDTPLVRSAGVVCRIEEDGSEAWIVFPGGIIRGPVSMKPVFTFVAETLELQPKDLPPATGAEYDRLEAARMFVTDGLLRIASSV